VFDRSNTFELWFEHFIAFVAEQRLNKIATLRGVAPVARFS
jgi:hypothetical protein